MKLTHLGTESGINGCPSLYATDRGTFVVQGWRVADAAALAALSIPPNESVVEIPIALIRFARRYES